MSLLEVSGLSVRFGQTEAVSDVSFSLQRGERFGIIGESGSGKTLTALAVTGLLPEGAQMNGAIRLDERPQPRLEHEMARLRGKRIGMVFQEPMTALNPLMRVSDQIEESIRLNEAHGAAQIEVPYLLKEVGLDLKHGDRFPHQLSGGQRQRAGEPSRHPHCGRTDVGAGPHHPAQGARPHRRDLRPPPDGPAVHQP